MKSNNLMTAAIVAIATLGAPATLTSCATTTYESLVPTTTRALNFRTQDEDGKIVTEADVIQGLKVSIPPASKYDIARVATIASPTGATAQKTEGVYGVYNDKNGDFELHYANFAKFPDNMFPQGSNIKVPFDLSLASSPTAISATLTSKGGVSNTTIINTNALGSFEEIEADAVNSVKVADIYVPRQSIVTSEFDTPYPDNAVYANFERLLGAYSKEKAPEYYGDVDSVFEIEKGNIFVIETDEFEHLVQISVFPYRDGSKVTSKFIYNYGLTADGGSTFDQSEIDSALKKIEEIALN